jgi:hypothetical protein
VDQLHHLVKAMLVVVEVHQIYLVAAAAVQVR